MAQARTFIFLILLNSFMSGCEIGSDSEPMGILDAIGTYVPNHDGAETLELRSDSVWIRSYIDTNHKEYIDSGSWELGNYERGGQWILIRDIFHRHYTWILDKSVYNNHKAIDNSEHKNSITLGVWYTYIYKNGKRIRIMVPDYFPDRYYEKTIVQ